MKDNRIMVCLFENRITVRDTLTKSILQLYTRFVKGSYFLCSFGRTKFLSCKDNAVFLWTLDDKKPMLGFYGHTDRITDIKSLNKDTFVTCSHDHTLRIWSISAQKCIKKLEVDMPIEKCLLRENTIIFCSRGYIFTWNIMTNKSESINFGDLSIKDLILLKDYLIVLTLDNVIEVFDLKSWKILNSYHPEDYIDKIYNIDGNDSEILLEFSDGPHEKISIRNIQAKSHEDRLKSCVRDCKASRYFKALDKAIDSDEIFVLNQILELIPLEIISTFVEMDRRFPEKLLLFSYSKAFHQFHDILFRLSIETYKKRKNRYIEDLLELYCKNVTSRNEIYLNILKSLGILEKIF